MKFRPGQSIDAELEAYEAAIAAEATDEVVEDVSGERADRCCGRSGSAGGSRGT